VLARAIEAEGLSTVSIVLIRNHAERTKPPRALFVPFPLGYALGRPDDPPFQHRVLAAAFQLLEAERGPVLADFPDETDAPIEVLAASQVSPVPSADAEMDPADEITRLRGYYERWLAEHDGRTMVGLAGIPQRRWRGLVRFLQAFADGRDLTYERPGGVPLARFLRYAADDIKAFYFEARMARRPAERDNQLHRWFWAETAMARLLVRVSERMAGSGDAELVQHARHVAR
jgi:hypothetical protein